MPDTVIPAGSMTHSRPASCGNQRPALEHPGFGGDSILTAPRCPGTRGDTCSSPPSGEIGVVVHAGQFLSEDAGI